MTIDERENAIHTPGYYLISAQISDSNWMKIFINNQKNLQVFVSPLHFVDRQEREQLVFTRNECAGMLSIQSPATAQLAAKPREA